MPNETMHIRFSPERLKKFYATTGDVRPEALCLNGSIHAKLSYLTHATCAKCLSYVLKYVSEDTSVYRSYYKTHDGSIVCWMIDGWYACTDEYEPIHIIHPNYYRMLVDKEANVLHYTDTRNSK